MAEGLSESSVNKPTNLTDKQEKGEVLECAVCLQQCVFPAQLPCGHIFCFLCIKGIANQSKRCAMCRQEIPRGYLEHPNLLKRPIANEDTESEAGYQWFYEGRNGWWQYDERTSKELETCYKAGERTCELLIAGFLYVTDLEAMLQLRRNDPSRRRRIKRDLSTIPKKGIAGLRTEAEDNNDDFQRSAVVEGRTDALIPATPTNTPQSPPSGRESPTDSYVENTINRMQSLALHSNNNLEIDDEIEDLSLTGTSVAITLSNNNRRNNM